MIEKWVSSNFLSHFIPSLFLLAQSSQGLSFKAPGYCNITLLNDGEGLGLDSIALTMRSHYRLRTGPGLADRYSLLSEPQLFQKEELRKQAPGGWAATEILTHLNYEPFSQIR